MNGLLQSTPSPAEFAAYQHIFDQVQGYALVRHGRRNVWLGLIRVEPGAAVSEVRGVLKSWGLRATSAARLRETLELNAAATSDAERAATRSEAVFAAGLSAAGFQALQAGECPVAAPFVGGFGGSFPLWRNPDGPFHAVVVIASNDVEKQLQAAANAVTQSFAGLAKVQWEQGAVLKPETDHFGYAEGISQPEFFMEGVTPGARWNASATLNYVLTPQPGHADEFGSHMAFLKIEQHVKEFEQLVAAAGASPEEVKAHIMGRRPDGSPLTDPAAGPPDRNNFDDASLTAGKCPLAAHIRKVNPRTAAERHHRIFRRGVFYTDGERRGALFQCFQSSLALGFEHIFQQWALNPDFPAAGTGQDPMLGERDWPPLPAGAAAPAGVAPVRRLTQILFGEYFYFPSIPFFGRL
jgi:Dyp-type peroxidase family